MDRWLGPVLAREAGRHHSDYTAYRAPRRAFSPELLRLPEGSVLEPSPLLGYSADTILLHFEWSPESGPRSPEVPLGRERELALASGLPLQSLLLAEERLAELASTVDLAELARSTREQAPAAALGGSGLVDQTACLSPDELREGPLAAGLVEDAGGASVGALVARWIGGDGLVLARDVRVGARSFMQGVVADWPVLSRYLLDEAGTDVTDARIVQGRHPGGVVLATLPATLVADPPALPVTTWTPQRTRLSVAWLAGLVSLGAVGWSLRSGMAQAERRARFAAAVSHELRTPLTTLRIYSDLLADGVVTDPAIRQLYLETIQAESGRLASLVENVLLHARIEQIAGQARRRVTVGELIEAITPVLRRRADESARPLIIELDLDPSSEVEVDSAAVERVLFNLVDNACKHGAGTEDPTLRLDVRRRANFVDLNVRDNGPGIPRELGSAVFEAFRRGEESGAPGAGLGLSLSRALARDMRGELSLVPSDRGACFRLSLRLA
jgi:signal transduction histidine kinase